MCCVINLDLLIIIVSNKTQLKSSTARIWIFQNIGSKDLMLKFKSNAVLGRGIPF